jgi:hypothetical protein
MIAGTRIPPSRNCPLCPIHLPVLPPPLAPSNAAYHYLGCAKTMALIGKAFAEANLAMEKK